MPANLVSNPSEKTTLDQNEGSDMTALYRAAIGSVNTDYYLSVFERFEVAGRAGPTWNSAACLSTLNWMVFRQIWTSALSYAAAAGGAALLLLGLSRPVGRFSDSAALCLLVVIGTSAFMIPGIWGNAMLHRHARKRMENALAATATVPEACALLSRRASSRQRIVWLALGNAALMGAVLSFYAAWPHTQRSGAVTGRVSQPAMAAFGAQAAYAPVATLPNAASERASVASAPAHSPPAAVSATPAPMVPSLLPALTPTPTPTPTPLPLPLPLPTIKVLATTTSAKRFYINVGLFAQADNARNAQAKLTAAGITPLTEKLDTVRGKRTRMRVGPFDTKVAAQTVAGKIQALKLEAVVFQQ